MNMKISNYKLNLNIIIPVIIFAIISIVTVYSSKTILSASFMNIEIKQSIWYIIGFFITFFIIYIKNNYIYKFSLYFYIILNIFLLILLLFTDPINNSRAWFNISGIGTFQPSEFMKIALILLNSNIIYKHNEKYSKHTIKNEFYLILKVFTVTLIPSILTFLQPDTGMVIIFFAISICMLFFSGISSRWFFSIGIIIFSILSTILLLYFLDDDLFINIFGNNFFYRIDRLLAWKDGVGYQIENALAAISSAGLLGFGIGNTPIYFPEAHTDFIFSVYASNFGFVGILFLISLILYFDFKIISIIPKTNNNINRYVTSGIIGMLLFQQIQSIAMNIGLLPIMGITLPFISYGGSSLISYMIMVGILLNISDENVRYTNKKIR